MTGILRYLRNSRAELSRVTWPTRTEVFQSTQATLVFVLLTTLFLLAADLIFNNVITVIL